MSNLLMLRGVTSLRSCFVAILSALALVAVLLTVSSSAEAVVVNLPAVQASLTNNWIGGQDFAPSAQLGVMVNGATVSNPPATDGSGQFFLGDSGMDLVAGDTIVVDDGVNPVETLVLVAMTFDVFTLIDPGTATGTLYVEGTAPVGPVQVGVGNETMGCNIETITDGAGAWSVTFQADGTTALPGSCGGFIVEADMRAQARVSDADNDETVVEPIEPPSVQASLTNNWINGQGFAPNTQLAVTVNGATVSNPPATDGSGQFDYGDSGMDLVAGDTIVVDDGVNPVETLVLLAMTFDVFTLIDPGTATGTLHVEGTAPLGPVHVNFGNEFRGCNIDTTIDGAGVWSVTFQADGTTALPGSCPGFIVEADMGAQAQVSDADNDQTVVAPTEPPSVQASLTNNWINGQGFAPSVLVAVTVNGATPPNQPSTNASGQFDYGESGLDLVAGDTIVVDDGVNPVETLVLLAMTFDVFTLIDPGTATGTLYVEGTAPVGPVHVNFGNEFGGCNIDTTIDGAGVWSVTFQADGTTESPGSCPGFIVEADMGAQAQVSDADNDETVVEPTEPPSVQASLTSNWISGQGFAPSVVVAVTVDGATPPNQPSTNASGQFDYGESGLDLVAGDTIVVDDGVNPVETLVLVAMTFDVFTLIDPGSATGTLQVEGTAPAGPVRVDFGNEFGGCGIETATNGLGAWSVTFQADGTTEFPGSCPGFIVEANMGASASVSDSDNDQTVVEPTQPPQIRASLTNNWIDGFGYEPSVSVSVMLNGATPPNQPSTDVFGNFFYGNSGLDLVAGDTIVVDDGVNPLETLVLLPMTFDVFTLINPGRATGTLHVEGTAPLGPVHVNFGNEFGGCNIDTTTDGSGLWSVTFQADGTTESPGSCGGFIVEADMGAQARIFDADNDETIVEPTQPPQVGASLTNNWIGGQGFAPAVSLTVQVNGVTPPSQPSTDVFGNFFYGNPGLDLVPGDTIVVDDGVNPVETLVLVPMTFDVFTLSDAGTAAGTLHVEGTAPVGPVQVGLGNETMGCNSDTTTDGSGKWSATFQADGTIGSPGSCGGFIVEADMGAQARIFDADNDATMVEPTFGFCDAKPVTINMNTNGGFGTGTAGDDVILGTPGDDAIVGLGGDDTICGEAGNDTIIGGDGADTMFGGSGRDIIRGNAGADTIKGELGNDRLLGGVDGDTIDGGDGSDYIGGFGGSDTISGGNGADTVFGGFGADVIRGNDGADMLFGLIGDDVIFGNAGNDTLNGDRGNDTLNGGSGDDTLSGGNGNDKVNGNNGDDILGGGRADDALNGGADTDACSGNKHNVADTATNCEFVFGVP